MPSFIFQLIHVMLMLPVNSPLNSCMIGQSGCKISSVINAKEQPHLVLIQSQKRSQKRICNSFKIGKADVYHTLDCGGIWAVVVRVSSGIKDMQIHVCTKETSRKSTQE